MSYKFKTNAKVEEIIKDSCDRDNLIKILSFIFKEGENMNLVFEDYKLEALANHISAMLLRKKLGEVLERIEESMFCEVDKEFIEFADKVVDLAGILPEGEKYLLSIHFQAAKLEK